ncbi:hypothetical protein HETIRDRAFT_452475 [Heterobasidion irregulare TC 32-1]|uniref:Uncharacterized protein n=1 Tax=Heterobasidion irregulare (strain TC 32-1) TaxID=747525 RepID=W4K5E1_HETIT|nr:uncharacterized protein HETIRDRAFT_452475 [Heterobasidion irregulare TC 32-1]ETW81027.1 hypothetical protein HETIRDRAFT_452475 [Heterobasidion irregulare TC 32-1]
MAPPASQSARKKQPPQTPSRVITDYFSRSSIPPDSDNPQSSPPAPQHQIRAHPRPSRRAREASANNIPAPASKRRVPPGRAVTPPRAQASSHMPKDNLSPVRAPAPRVDGVEHRSPRKGTHVRVLAAQSTFAPPQPFDVPARLTRASLLKGPIASASAPSRPELSQTRDGSPRRPQMITLSKRKRDEDEDEDEGVPAVLPASSPLSSSPPALPPSSPRLPSSALPTPTTPNAPTIPILPPSPTPDRRSSRKRPRLSPPTPSPRKLSPHLHTAADAPPPNHNDGADDDDELVPSSQSDEHELCLPKDLRRDPRAVHETIESWRRTSAAPSASSPARLPALDFSPTTMDVDGPASPMPLAFELSVAQAGSELDPRSSSLSPPSSPAPSPSRGASLPHPSSAEVSALLRTAPLPPSSYTTPSPLPHTLLLSPAPAPVPAPPSPSPPPPTAALRPTTPVPLDSKAKTAQIIAQLRADATRAAHTAPSPDATRTALAALDAASLSSDSSASDDELFVRRTNIPKSPSKQAASRATARSRAQRAPSSPLTTPRSPSLSPSPDPSGAPARKQNTRRGPAPAASSPSKPARPTRARRAPPAPADAYDNNNAKGKRKGKQGADPLEALLREKRSLDRAGRGMDALRRAEVADLGGARGGLGSEDEDEDNEGVVGGLKEDDDEERVLRDEEAAARAARRGEAMRVGGWAEGARRDDGGGGADGEEEFDVEEVVAAEERERLLGEKEGKAVGSILDADRIGGAKRARVVGVQVWGVDGEEEMEMEMEGEEGEGVAEEWPEWLLEEAGEGERPRMVEMLSAAVARRDAARIKFMFDAGLLHTLDLSTYPSILAWTCKLALSTRSTPLCQSAFHFLRHSSAPRPEAAASLTHLIVDTLRRLGMQPALLRYISSDTAPDAPNVSRSRRVRDADRAEVLYRLVVLVTAFARNGWLRAEDVPAAAMALLLVGADRAASHASRRDVIVALQAVCARLPAELPDDDDGPPTTLESALAARVLEYAAAEHVGTQALLLSLFAGMSSHATHAYSRPSPSSPPSSPPPPPPPRTPPHAQDPYTALPSLDPLVDALSDTRGPFEAGEATDYDELGARVAVLGVALTGVDGYVAQELARQRETRFAALEEDGAEAGAGTGTGMGMGREPAPLELVKNRLDVLHARIVDTRAAHLDRSQTKGALQRLAMRVHYQRDAILKGGPRKLMDYWT